MVTLSQTTDYLNKTHLHNCWKVRSLIRQILEATYDLLQTITPVFEYFTEYITAIILKRLIESEQILQFQTIFQIYDNNICVGRNFPGQLKSQLVPIKNSLQLYLR